MMFKKAFLAVICGAAIFLTGCGDKTVYKDGKAEIKNANITVSFPEDWKVATDNDTYNDICDIIDLDGVSAKDLKAMYDAVGAQILLSARSPGDDITVTFTQTAKGDRDAEEILRSLHDNAIFDYRASDLFTESSFGEYDWGGVSGYLSVIRVFYGIGEPEYTTEGRQFYFERGGYIFALVVNTIGDSDPVSDISDITDTIVIASTE